MKRIFLLIILLITFQLSHAQINNYEEGDIVNDFTVTDVRGNVHNLYSITAEGKYVLIDFFYIACGGCQSLIPIFNEFYDKYGCNEGDVFCIAINAGYDKDEDVIAFEGTYGGEEFNHAPAVSRDGGAIDVNADFDPMYYPALCLIGPDNMMVKSNISPYETLEDLEAGLPSEFNPQPMSCSLSIDEYSSNTNFTIFPNPTNGKEITIKLNKFNHAKINIYNILGENIYTGSINETRKTINPNLIVGTYFISLQTDKSISTHKLIVN